MAARSNARKCRCRHQRWRRPRDEWAASASLGRLPGRLTEPMLAPRIAIAATEMRMPSEAAHAGPGLAMMSCTVGPLLAIFGASRRNSKCRPKRASLSQELAGFPSLMAHLRKWQSPRWATNAEEVYQAP